MSAFANVTLYEASGTGSPVVFTPSRIGADGVALLLDNTSASLDNKQKLSFSTKLPSSAGSVARLVAKLQRPILDPVSGLKIAEAVATIEFVIPKSMTAADRLKMNWQMNNILTVVPMTDMVQNLGSVY